LTHSTISIKARELFDRLIELQALRPDDHDEAFASAERQRARVLLDRLTIRALSLEEVQGRLQGQCCTRCLRFPARAAVDLGGAPR